MHSRSPWPAVFQRLLVWVGLFGFLGWLTGYLAVSLLLGICVLLVWHYFNLLQLERWLRTERRSAPPASRGVWGDVFNHIYRFQKRNRERRKRLTSVLRRFRESAMAMPDGVVILTGSGELSWWNDQAGIAFGFRRSQDEGQRIINLVRQPQFVEFFQAGEFAKPLELIGSVDETSALEIRIVPYGSDSLLMLVRDVGERRRLQRVRRDFVANISHELRTPLTVIHGCIETMADGRDEIPESWHRAIELMQLQTGRMERLVNELVMLTRLQSTTIANSEHVVDVPSVLNAIRDEVTIVSGGQEHNLVFDIEPSLRILGADSELRSAFSNLIHNAVHYTPAHGLIRVRWYSDYEGAHLVVTDTGVGVAAHDIPRLTERFYRTDEGRSRRGAGTGLGLAITKHVLQRHQARLRIDSKLGEGSVFTCDFPQVRIVKSS